VWPRVATTLSTMSRSRSGGRRRQLERCGTAVRAEREPLGPRANPAPQHHIRYPAHHRRQKSMRSRRWEFVALNRECGLR
jgi:hypothetical protein